MSAAATLPKTAKATTSSPPSRAPKAAPPAPAAPVAPGPIELFTPLSVSDTAGRTEARAAEYLDSGKCDPPKAKPKQEPPAPAEGFKLTPEFIDELLTPSTLAAAFSKYMGQAVDAFAIRDYIESLIDDCGVAGDPLAEILVEQVAMMRFVSSLLHSGTALCAVPADQAVASASACSTSAELRRTIQALQEHRGPKKKVKASQPKPRRVAPEPPLDPMQRELPELDLPPLDPAELEELMRWLRNPAAPPSGNS